MSTLSEAFRDHPLHLNQIIPLDFQSVRTLPESHIWSEPDPISNQTTLSIPLIDFSHPQANQQIVNACETYGVFQITNHGISSDIISRAESETRRLFSLPARQKLKALRGGGGSTGYGIARITPFFSKYMWHEGFTIIGSVFEHAKLLWADDYSRFCEAMESYQAEMKKLSERLTNIIFNSLNITTEHPWVDPSTALQLNSYPACPDPSRAMGLAPHTDTSLMTILHQNSTNGLQIFNPEMGWVRVDPISDALVVNVGDLLHILSNGRFVNVLHRVFVDQSSQRFSMAYFYSPPSNFTITPKIVDEGCGGVGRYRPVTIKEYAGLKAKNFEKALSSIEI